MGKRIPVHPDDRYPDSKDWASGGLVNRPVDDGGRGYDPAPRERLEDAKREQQLEEMRDRRRR